jgi:hypothetical protein
VRLFKTLAALAVGTSAYAEAQLPASIRAELDAAYRGWSLAPVHGEIARWFAEYGFDYAPSLVTGDFDNDRRRDYAVQIIAKSKSIVVAFLDRSGRWERHQLTSDPADPFTFLLRYGRGEKDFDFEKMKPFRYTSDAVGVMYFEKTPFTYMYRRGKFIRKSAPSDEEFDTN